MSNSTTTAGSYGIHHTSGTWGRSAILPAMPRPGPAPDVGVRDFGRSSEMNGEGCGMWAAVIHKPIWSWITKVLTEVLTKVSTKVKVLIVKLRS